MGMHRSAPEARTTQADGDFRRTVTAQPGKPSALDRNVATPSQEWVPHSGSQILTERLAASSITSSKNQNGWRVNRTSDRYRRAKQLETSGILRALESPTVVTSVFASVLRCSTARTIRRKEKTPPRRGSFFPVAPVSSPSKLLGLHEAVK